MWSWYSPSIWVEQVFINSFPPGQNGCHFGRWHFQMNFLEWNDGIQIKISLKFVTRSPIDNEPAWFQVMAWGRTGDKPLPEPVHWCIYVALGGDELQRYRKYMLKCTAMFRMPQNLIDDTLTLVHSVSWCLQILNHYLNQCCLIIKGALWLSNENNFTSTCELNP